MFALGRDLNKRACQQRSDTRSGILDVKRDKTMDWSMMREECREGYQNADHTTWSPLVGHVMADSETLYAKQVRLHAIPRPFPALSRAITSLAGQAKGWREALPWHMG